MKIILIICSLQLIIFSGCSHYILCEYADGAKEYNEFIETPFNGETDKQQKFSLYPIEKQIDIFLFAKNCPDNTTIQSLLYEHGEEKIPNIVRRVQTTGKVKNKADLVDLLFGINRRCRCISENSDVIKQLDDVEKQYDANKIVSNDPYQKFYKNSLRSLKDQIDSQGS